MLLRRTSWLVPVCLGLLALYLLVPAGGTPADDATTDEKVTQYLNLGKAFYENPTTQAEAVVEFKKALDLRPNSVREQLNYGLALLRAARTAEAVAILEKVQKEDPALPHTWFNLGIYYKRDGQFDQAIEQFQQLAKLAPNEAITHYNLGTIYKLQSKTSEAQREFELARDLNPALSAPHFQLFNIYRQQKKMDEANRELALFKERKTAQDSIATPEDIEWCEFAEVYEPMKPEPDTSKRPVELSFMATMLGDVKPGPSGLLALDVYGSGKPDLLVYSADGIAIYRGGTQKATGTGLEDIRDVISVAPGDFNNDGETDLCVLTKSAALLYENKNGVFTKSDYKLPDGSYNAAVWIDFDHDYDLDLFLLGKKSVLLRNQGKEGFVEHPFPFAGGEATAGAAFRLVADTKAKDLVVTYKEHPAVLYLDQLTGTYKPQSLDKIPAGAFNPQAVDLNNDGNLDLVFQTSAGTAVARNMRTGFADPINLTNGPAAFSDLANRGFTDLITTSGIKQSVGNLEFIDPKSVTGLSQASTWAAADFTNDGLIDLAVITPDNKVVLLQNKTALKSEWVRVQIAGVKNLKIPLASEIEVKAGSSYQKKVYNGLPVLFGVGSHDTVDTIRITWPNGLIQNEMKQAAAKDLSFKEAQRLSGSCPLIYVWNGTSFQYITDVLGVAPLGAMSGDGQFFPTDHTEYVALQGEWLAPHSDFAGRKMYEIKLTEELSEVSYFDQVNLIAVDHPASTGIYSNEKWKSPPFPEFRLYSLNKRVYPISAKTQHGDVLDRLLHQDKRYVNDFERNYVGVAEMHTLDLDFGKAAKDNRAFLVLNGWVDWADGSTFLQQAQEKRDLAPPSLQVKDKSGRWVTVIEDMGMPSGKPKTIAVDLTGKFLSDSREVRIVTNMCVFWDEIFLGEDAGKPLVQLTTLTPDHSEVHFRGFSPSHIHPERKQPESFDFVSPTTTSFWNPTPSTDSGKYTRYGDVTELTEKIDDKLVVMGSGDELTLRYDQRELPPLKPGWRRDYLLRVEGWAKDRDANTAFSQSVDPLPFHGMSRYPYPATEHYPNDADHQEYLRKYNTRPALRLIRPLAPGADVANQHPLIQQHPISE
ncbi:MAG: FG-GAP-like repeat-containing protein [Bryobacteraceae bacterium]